MNIHPPKQPFFTRAWFLALISLLIVAGCFYWFSCRTSGAYEVTRVAGNPEIYSFKEKAWVAVNQGDLMGLQDSLRTGPGDEVDLVIRGKFQIRIKENSEFQSEIIKGEGDDFKTELKLLRGILLGSTHKGFAGQNTLQIETEAGKTLVRGTLFRLEYQDDQDQLWAGILEGKMSVEAEGKVVDLRKLEKSQVSKGAAPSEPTKLTPDEWMLMREAYDLLDKTALSKAEQLALAKEAGGSLFGFVEDFGAFYPEIGGFSEAVFSRDESGDVHLRLDYDVFSPLSFVGLYLKTKGLDLMLYKGLSYEVREVEGEASPDNLGIELKKETSILRRFLKRGFKGEWQKQEILFRASRETPIHEIVYLFHHDKVGREKKGTLEFKNFNLLEF